MLIKNLFFNFTQPSNGDGGNRRNVLTTTQLRSVIERERARADRNGHVFSLIIFHVRENKIADHLIDEFITKLTKRLRETDVLGWFNQLSLGVFLPDTSTEGAQKLTAAICRDLPCKDISHRIFTYPDDWFFKDYSDSDNDVKKSAKLEKFREPANGGGTRSGIPEVLKAGSDNTLFLQPIPVWKRMFDIFIASIIFVAISPLFIFIAIFIKIVSPGPVFFKQIRLGFQGKPFTFWKFRTMEVNAPPDIHKKLMKEIISSNNGNIMQKLDTVNDPRIIPFGKFLRNSCLDELPQIFNVLRGDMSFVGPRPCLPYEAEEYQLWHTRRFDVIPGLTGLWQVNGKNKTTFKEMIRYDIKYKKRRSFRNDLKILLKTFPAIVNFIRDDLISKRKPEKAAWNESD